LKSDEWTLQFNRNEKIGLGVEVELQLIDPRSGDLHPVGGPVLSALAGQPGAERIKSELFQSMLEVDTPICENAFEAGASLR
jgi:carboxylate-amine ligase